MHYLCNIDLVNVVNEVTAYIAVLCKAFCCLECSLRSYYVAIVIFNNSCIDQNIAVFLVLYVRVLDSTVSVNDELLAKNFSYLILVIISCK